MQIWRRSKCVVCDTWIQRDYQTGHDRPGTQLRVAALHAGVSMNDAVDDAGIDALSGTSILNGVPVTVEACGESGARRPR